MEKIYSSLFISVWWGSLPQVNGERVSPPLSPNQGIKITLNSRYLQLTTDFGLSVRFDGNMQGGENKDKHHVHIYMLA